MYLFQRRRNHWPKTERWAVLTQGLHWVLAVVLKVFNFRFQTTRSGYRSGPPGARHSNSGRECGHQLLRQGQGSAVAGVRSRHRKVLCRTQCRKVSWIFFRWTFSEKFVNDDYLIELFKELSFYFTTKQYNPVGWSCSSVKCSMVKLHSLSLSLSLRGMAVGVCLTLWWPYLKLYKQ